MNQYHCTHKVSTDLVLIRPKAGAREGQQGINQAGMEVAVGQVSFNIFGVALRRILIIS